MTQLVFSKAVIVLYFKIKFCISNSVVTIFIGQFHELEHELENTNSSEHFDPEGI